VEPEVIPASEMKNLIPGTTDQSWAALRHRGTGPRYIKVMRKVYYRRADIDVWLDSNVYTRTDRPVNDRGGDPAESCAAYERYTAANGRGRHLRAGGAT
jgi:hypothetical protein